MSRYRAISPSSRSNLRLRFQLVQTEQNLVSFKELKAFKGKEKKADFNVGRQGTSL